MKWWLSGEGDYSFSQEGEIVENDKYKTKIVIIPATATDRYDPHERMGSNSDEQSLDVYMGYAKDHQQLRKPLLYAVLSACFFFIVIILLTVGFSKDLFWSVPDVVDGNTGISNYSNTSNGGIERADRLFEYLMAVGADMAERFQNPVSPESRALVWMQYEDPLNLDPGRWNDRYRIDQRFALLTLWFQADSEWFNQTNWLSDDNECSWKGVTCASVSLYNRRSRSGTRNPYDRKLREGDQIVTKLNLAQNNLQGNFPPDVQLLKHLTSLNLSGNQINGMIPTTLSSMTLLEELNLEDNLLSQQVSLDFSRMSKLFDVDLSNNQLEGTIPASLFSVASVTRIRLDNNKFTGRISEGIGDLVNLCKQCMNEQDAVDDCQSNPVVVARSRSFFLFVLHRFPDEFTAGGNLLYGTLPSLSRVGNLATLLLGGNRLSGDLDFTGLQNLKELGLENNKFSGPLPDLSDAPGIQVLRLGSNDFDAQLFPMNYLKMGNITNLGLNNLFLTGAIPAEFGTLTNLEVLQLENNLFNGVIPSSITNMSTLQQLAVHDNLLSGSIPFEISYLTNLEKLTLSSNQLRSSIPVAIRRLTSLKTLAVNSNFLDGQIPASIESLSNLEVLDLSDNAFTGSLPDSFWEMTSLRKIIFANNFLAGRIPGSIGNLKDLRVLNVASNAFRGRVPESITFLTNLAVLDLSFNFFGGPIPNTIGDMVNLRALLLGSNYDENNESFGFDGTIPASITNMVKLRRLEVNRNRITGGLPSQHEFLEFVQTYDVSENQMLEGSIPKGFSNMNQLNEIRIYGTNIDGDVPIEFCSRNVSVLKDCDEATAITCSCCLCSR